MIRAGARLDATDLVLPDPVKVHGNGDNTITATAWAVLPTFGASVQLVNPHPALAMLVDVRVGAWLSASANAVRAGVAISGSLTLAAGIGGGGAEGWGEVILSGAAAVGQHAASFTVELPPSTTPATFTMQAYRDSATGTQLVRHPTLRVIPLRFVE